MFWRRLVKMKLTNNIKIIDLALYLKKEKILVIADTHIGYEEYLNKQGILVPRFQFKEIIKRLEKILKNIKINEKNKLKKIIINGDIKHEFGKISETEWRHTLRLLDFFKKYCNEIILIKGNHDTILGPIAKKRGIKVADYFVVDDILLVHGDKTIEEIIFGLGYARGIHKNNLNQKNKKHSKISQIKKFNTIIIGHEHPAVSIREDNRAELFKCFLVGRYKRKNLIVQPSFNLVYEGTDILKEELLSPFLHQNLNNFRCFI